MNTMKIKIFNVQKYNRYVLSANAGCRHEPISVVELKKKKRFIKAGNKTRGKVNSLTLEDDTAAG